MQNRKLNQKECCSPSFPAQTLPRKDKDLSRKDPANLVTTSVRKMRSNNQNPTFHLDLLSTIQGKKQKKRSKTKGKLFSESNKPSAYI